MSALLNVKQFVRFDEHGNLHVPNKLFVACQAYVQTPFLNDTSSRVATTEWVRAQISSLTGVSVSETDPIWVFEKALYYTKLQADARYLQSFTETDPTVSAWAKASVKPTYTFAELLSKPTTIAGYGITDIPTTLPASDVYAWAKAATKPSYAYSEITDKPTLFSGSYTDLTNKPTLFSGAYADLTGKPTLFSGSYTDLTNKPTIPAAQVNSDWTATTGLAQILNKPSLFSGAYTDLTGKPTIPTNNNELTNGAGYLTSYTETDPIWTAEKTSYYTKTAADARYLQSYTETDPIWISEKANYALKTYVDTSISNLVASAPAALDTLNELALALGSDANFSTTVTTLIGTKEPSITAGTTLQYWRGDKTWQTLPIYTLSGLGGEPTITAGTNLQYWRGDKSWQTLPIYTLSGLGGQPLDADLTAIAALAGTSGFLKKTAADTWALDTNTYLTTASAGTTYEPVITAGTISQYWRGDKSWQTLPTYNLSLYVPYTGATGSVDLGVNSITLFNITSNNVLIVKNTGSVTGTNGFSSFSGNLANNGFTFAPNNSSYHRFIVPTSSNYDYTFPASSGTIALTSNIPTLSGLSGVPTSRTLTINGTAYDLSADRAWTITTASSYTLPTATSSVLGGVIIGTGVTITSGVISVSTNYQAPLSGTGIVKSTAGTITYLTDNTANWDTAYTDRNKWDGGATGLVAATGRTSLGLVIGTDVLAYRTFGTAANSAATDFALDVHTHTIANVTGLQTALDGKEPSIAAGTTAQYWRGDKSWQTLPTYSLPIASTSVLGGIKVGTNLSIDANGVLSANDTSVAWSELTSVPTTFTPSAHTHAISDITSIVITSVANNQLLKYNSTSAKWENWTPTYISSYTDTNTTYSLTIPVSTTKIRLTGSDASASDITFTGGGATTITRTSATEFTISSTDTDTNTTYVNFTRTVAGLVPNPGGATTNRYLREDGTWVIPPDTDTDTVYVHPTTAGNKHIPAGGAAGQILRWSADGAATWGADVDTDTNTWNANTKDVAGYVAAPGAVANKVWKTDALGNPAWRDDADTDTDTNTVTQIRRENADGTTSATDYRTGNIRLRQGTNVTIAEVSAGIFQISSSYVDTDTNTWDANTKTVAGYVSAPGDVANKVWKTDGTGNPGWRDDADTDTNTWNANSKTVAGYVSAPGDVANKVWKTDATGNPGWRDDADTDTNTTYTASTGLTLTGTAFSITDTITTAATANTIAKRDGSAVISAGGFYQTSSKTLKTSIIDYNESALDIINKINVVSFYYKADVKNKRIGFIAEDSPEEVATIDHNVMDTNSTVGLLLKAIQQLEARIKVLENV